MTATALAVCAAALVFWAGWIGSGIHRLERLLPQRPRTVAGLAPCTALGRQVFRRLGPKISMARRLSITDDACTAMGVGLLATFATVLVSPRLAVASAGLSCAWPWWERRRVRHNRSERLERDLPLVVDLFRIALGSGLNIAMATNSVVRRYSGPLSDELATALAQVRHGRRLADALEDVVDRTGDMTRPLMAALVASERYGAALSANLERLVFETRIHQQHRAERAAKRLSVQLLFPLAGCTLPAFALLTVVPLIAGSFSSLAPMFS